MQSSNSDATAHAQAAVTEPVTATPSFAPPVNAAPPSLFQTLQEKASAGLQATAQMMKGQAEMVAQAASDRVATARAGKKLLDEGGETAASAILAKQAATDSAELDRRIAAHVDRAILTLDDSVEKLRVADASQKTLDHAQELDLPRVISEHEKRAAAFRQIAQMLEMPASFAQMSAEESDAVTILQAKEGCATAFSKTSLGLDSVKQKALASFSSGSPADTSIPASSQNDSASEAHATVAPAPTLLEGMRANAVLGAQMVKQAASERLDTAKAGKSLLDIGGDAAAQLVVAKNATLQAAMIDRDVAQRVDSAVARFDASATKLRALVQEQDTASILSHESASRLADEHEVRTQLFREIAELLQKPISCMSMNPAEWDAHSFVRLRQNCGVLQKRTNEGFEAAKGLAYTNCTSDVDGEGTARRIRSVCA